MIWLRKFNGARKENYDLNSNHSSLMSKLCYKNIN